MVDRILRVSYEGTFGTWDETTKRTIDIVKFSNGEYYLKFSRLYFVIENGTEKKKRLTTKRKIEAVKVDKILKKLSKVQIPAFPEHHMGCDGGFTEIEMGGYAGKSSYRWWSGAPEGCEELDKVTQSIISDFGFEECF